MVVIQFKDLTKFESQEHFEFHLSKEAQEVIDKFKEQFVEFQNNCEFKIELHPVKVVTFHG